MHHNSVRQSHYHWGYLLLNPHNIRPPDTHVGIYSRFGLWLSLICIFIFICPRVGTQFISVFDDFARTYAERILSYNSEFPRTLEGFELGFVSRLGSSPLSIVYDISPNNESWLFITPCSHSNYSITIQSFISKNESIDESGSTIDERPFTKWYMKVRKVDMKHSSRLGIKINISNWKRQEMHVRNLVLGVMRLYIDKSDLLPAVYMIRQYSGLIDAFYPRIPPNPSVRVCVADDYKSIISVFVSRAFNADTYCISFNMEENLPNFCSAQLRLDKEYLEREIHYINLGIRRPSVFDDYYRLNKISTIQKFKFRCFKTNIFQVALDDTFRNSIVFINIFAINSDTKFTDAYEPFQFKWKQDNNECKDFGKQVKINKLKPHLWIMGNETIMFNITGDPNGTYPNKLLYQSCIHPHTQSLQVFQQESQIPICVEIVHNRLKALCTTLKPGTYRLQHTLNIKPQNKMPVGQLYFLSDNMRPFPHLDCNKTTDFSIKLNQIALDSGKTQYKINISFNQVRSPYDITYYFHIIDFRIPNDKSNNVEFLSQVESNIKAERNFCKFVQSQNNVRRSVYRETFKGLGCSGGVQKKVTVAIPRIFDGNNTYAVLVYFSRASDWRLDFVQFYSNRIFTMSSEEDVF